MRSSLFASPRTGGHQTATSREAAERRDRERAALMRNDERSVERENDEILDALGNDVEALKKAATGMRDDVAAHNTFIDQLYGRFNQASTGVRRQTGQLDHVMRQYGCKHTAYMAVAIVLVVIALYYVLSAAMSSKKPATPAQS